MAITAAQREEALSLLFGAHGAGRPAWDEHDRLICTAEEEMEAYYGTLQAHGWVVLRVAQPGKLPKLAVVSAPPPREEIPGDSMDLRDYFAGIALASYLRGALRDGGEAVRERLLEETNGGDGGRLRRLYARAAYMAADAMVSEKSR
jgi:hypothetical protein